MVKLLESLYGLQQATHKFKEHLNNSLSTMGFKRLCRDTSVYLGFHNGAKILVTSHVDDFLFVSPNAEANPNVYYDISRECNGIFEIYYHSKLKGIDYSP